MNPWVIFAIVVVSLFVYSLIGTALGTVLSRTDYVHSMAYQDRGITVATSGIFWPIAAPIWANIWLYQAIKHKPRLLR